MSNSTAATQGHLCACYCNQVITTKATYKPGHDAAHVSQLIQGLLNLESDQGRAAVTDDVIKGQASELPSEALQNKYLRAANRLFAAKDAKPAKGKGEWQDVDHTVAKSGRWTYPVQEWVVVTSTGDAPSGKFQRNTKRDGSGEWVAVDSADLIDA